MPSNRRSLPVMWGTGRSEHQIGVARLGGDRATIHVHIDSPDMLEHFRNGFISNIRIGVETEARDYLRRQEVLDLEDDDVEEDWV